MNCFPNKSLWAPIQYLLHLGRTKAEIVKVLHPGYKQMDLVILQVNSSLLIRYLRSYQHSWQSVKSKKCLINIVYSVATFLVFILINYHYVSIFFLVFSFTHNGFMVQWTTMTKTISSGSNVMKDHNFKLLPIFNSQYLKEPSSFPIHEILLQGKLWCTWCQICFESFEEIQRLKGEMSDSWQTMAYPT